MTDFVLNILLQTVRISVPYILAAVGGVFSESSGVINIGLEGIMLNGAFCSVVGTYYLGNPWLGLIAGVTGGIITSVIHAVSCIRYKVNHIVSGVAINIFAVGITKFFLILVFGSSSNSARIIPLKLITFPVIGGISPVIVITVFIVVLAHVILFKTPFGLRLRACGENPAAADSLGINVWLMRYSGVAISGALAGLAGAWLAMQQSQFTSNMSSGRGFIALAAMIFGKWTPLGATGAALIFGLAESIQIHVQTMGVNIPSQFIQSIPYLLTIIVLSGLIGRSEPPAAVGKPYPEELSL
ncbi:MAG: ABC transporter permease [Elusimicrobia bacterium]|nr:ABC transporter permease [Elusimicrobiota bacterium]